MDNIFYKIFNKEKRLVTTDPNVVAKFKSQSEKIAEFKANDSDGKLSYLLSNASCEEKVIAYAKFALTTPSHDGNANGLQVSDFSVDRVVSIVNLVDEAVRYFLYSDQRCEHHTTFVLDTFLPFLLNSEY
ncbi:MAG: hypothetical protein KAS32_14705 [Candidatus Peribacteraceae bacterium]|nr:hypothetical protein [Candidatus Peribacteraceae bacterium]